MTEADIRRARLADYLSTHLGGVGAELARRIDRQPSQVSDMLAGRKAFGEKIARHIEQQLQLPRGYLDTAAQTGAGLRGGIAASLDADHVALLALFDGLGVVQRFTWVAFGRFLAEGKDASEEAAQQARKALSDVRNHSRLMTPTTTKGEGHEVERRRSREARGAGVQHQSPARRKTTTKA